MNRRHFLSLIGAAPLAARSYFDMGQAWQRNASGLWAPPVNGGLLTISDELMRSCSVDIERYVAEFFARGADPFRPV